MWSHCRMGADSSRSTPVAFVAAAELNEAKQRLLAAAAGTERGAGASGLRRGEVEEAQVRALPVAPGRMPPLCSPCSAVWVCYVCQKVCNVCAACSTACRWQWSGTRQDRSWTLSCCAAAGGCATPPPAMCCRSWPRSGRLHWCRCVRVAAARQLLRGCSWSFMAAAASPAHCRCHACGHPHFPSPNLLTPNNGLTAMCCPPCSPLPHPPNPWEGGRHLPALQLTRRGPRAKCDRGAASTAASAGPAGARCMAGGNACGGGFVRATHRTQHCA